MSTNVSTGRKMLPPALLVALAFVGILVVNGLANALPLNGANTGVLSDEIPNLFVPAGLTFSVWGLIYLLLTGYVVALLKEAWRGGSGAWTGSDALLFLVNAAANIGWIFAWHWRLVGLAMALMLVILGTLIALEQGNQLKLGPGGALDPAAGGKNRGLAARRFFLTVPLRVYLGWISVATIANATALLVKTGWDGFGLDPRFWTILVIIAGLAVALGFSLWKRQVAAPLVVVWAYAGIVVKRLGTDASYSTAVWAAALASAILILISFLPGRLISPAEKK